jgi:hypothetical protein
MSITERTERGYYVGRRNYGKREEKMLNESMGVVQKIERRGRKRSGGVNRERVCGLKCVE